MWRPNLYRFFTRPRKGQTWQVEEMLKLFLVIIVFGGAVVLVIAATGGLTSVLNDFCMKNPEWCGAASDDQYGIAKASFEALEAAINCVSNPDTCMCISSPCRFKPDTTIKSGFLGFVSAQKNDDTVTVECEQEVKSTTPKAPIIIFEDLLLSSSVAEERCKANCNEGCYNVLTSSGEALKYEIVRDKTLLRFSCGYDGSTYDPVIAFSRQEARTKCIESLRNNGITISEEPPDSKLHLQYLDVSVIDDSQYNIISGEARKCTCDLLGQRRETYSVFGFTDEEARDLCVADSETKSYLTDCCFDSECNIKSSEFTPGISSYGYCFDENKCEDYEGDIAFSPGTKLLNVFRFTCKHELSEKQPLSCSVTNFNLPENFAGVFAKPKEYIAGYLDPSFLVYWQSFPQGEDSAWSGYGTWFQGAGTILLGAMCVGPIVSKVWKGAKFLWEVATLKKLREAKAAGILTRGQEIVLNDIDNLEALLKKTADAQKGSKAETILKFTNEGNVYIVKEGIEGTISSSKYVRDIFNAKIIEKYGTFDDYLKAADQTKLYNAIKKPKNSFSAIVAGESRQVDFFKYLTKTEQEAVLKYAFNIDSKAMAYINSVIAKEGLVGISAYIAAALDKKLDDNTNKPDSLVLSRAMKPDPDTLPLNDMVDDTALSKGSLVGRGMPVILDKDPGSITGKRDQSPFYLASPCHADIEIWKTDVRCQGYKYNSKTGETTCDSPKVIDYYGPIFNIDPKHIRECGTIETIWESSSVPGAKLFIEKTKEFIKNLKTEGNIFTQNDVINEWKIHDPINDMDYYFSGSGASIGEQSAYRAVKGETPLDFCIERTGDECNEYVKNCKALPAYEILGFDPKEKGLGEVNLGRCILNTGYQDSTPEFYKPDCKEKCFESPYDNFEIRMSVLGHLTDTEPERIDNIYGLMLTLYYYKNGAIQNFDYLVFLDMNNDKKVDFVSHRSILSPYTYYTNFEDTDYDGTVDAFSEGYDTDSPTGERGCRVAAIVAKPDRDEYSGKDGNDYNFCFQEETYTGAALMSVSLAADASALAVPSPGTWAASVITNCALFVYHATADHAWPGESYEV